jgi:NCAIR mutase (PurE)-related protein
MMNPIQLKKILEDVASGRLSADQAAPLLKEAVEAGREDVKLDFERFQRCGIPEVIFCEGKSLPQLRDIVRQFLDQKHPVFGTRIAEEDAMTLQDEFSDLVYHREAAAITLDHSPLSGARGLVCVVSAGTSDERVAAEAALTARRMGAEVLKIADVGVAGLHRLMERLDEIKTANVVIVVAGMEGALPSVVGGLIDKPVLAVPTSIGYGFHFDGLTAFLAMMNSCVAGVSVVNMDNGFGAGIAAAQINRLIEDARA